MKSYSNLLFTIFFFFLGYFQLLPVSVFPSIQPCTLSLLYFFFDFTQVKSRKLYKIFLYLTLNSITLLSICIHISKPSYRVRDRLILFWAELFPTNSYLRHKDKKRKLFPSDVQSFSCLRREPKKNKCQFNKFSARDLALFFSVPLADKKNTL